jgi:L-fuconolactonase
MRAATRGSLKVDAHQHFWRYTPEEFGWIDESMAVIQRDFLPGDLLPLLDQSEIDATVAVQACQTLEEAEWLLDLADENEWIAGVVGWVPLAGPGLQQALEKLSADPTFKGVRHILQAEPDEYFDRKDFNAGLALLLQYALTYDLVVLEHQLPATIRLVDRHPSQPFVLDHLAKPKIAAHELEPWRANILELARRPHVLCKLSGMVTEADFNSWTTEDLRPYVETVLEAFGPGRLIFGSDWPVCTLAAGYTQWARAASELLSQLSGDEQGKIYGGNAMEFYRLPQRHFPPEVD